MAFMDFIAGAAADVAFLVDFIALMAFMARMVKIERRRKLAKGLRSFEKCFDISFLRGTGENAWGDCTRSFSKPSKATCGRPRKPTR